MEPHTAHTRLPKTGRRASITGCAGAALLLCLFTAAASESITASQLPHSSSAWGRVEGAGWLGGSGGGGGGDGRMAGARQDVKALAGSRRVGLRPARRLLQSGGLVVTPSTAATINNNPSSDLTAILAFRDALMSPLQVMLYGWSNNSDPCGGAVYCVPFPVAGSQTCAWPGITCKFQRIAGISLLPEQRLSNGGVQADPRMRLSGRVTDALSKLDSLELLVIVDQMLTGPLLELGALIQLKEVYLSGNGFTGRLPPSWQSLTFLQSLDLGGNSLVGPVPASWRGMYSLKLLGLRGNKAVCASSIPLAPSVRVTSAGCWEGANCLVRYPAVAYTNPLLAPTAGGPNAAVAVAAPAPAMILGPWSPPPPPQNSGGGFSGRSNLLLAFVVVALVVFGVLGSLLRLWRMHRLHGHLAQMQQMHAAQRMHEQVAQNGPPAGKPMYATPPVVVLQPDGQVAVAHRTDVEAPAPALESLDGGPSPAAAASLEAAPSLEGAAPTVSALGAGPSSGAASQTSADASRRQQTALPGTLARSSSLGTQWHLAWMTGTMHPGTLARMRELMILQEGGTASNGRRRPAPEAVPFYLADVPKDSDSGART